MSLLQGLKSLFRSEEERDAHDLLSTVRGFYVDSRHREQQLRHQSEMAPHAAGRDGLLELAGEETEVAERLRQIILGLGSFAGEVNRPAEPLGALNYWGRLAQSLEAHKEAVNALRDEATLITDGLPEVADELRLLARFEESHASRIRGLLAKADPQALN